MKKIKQFILGLVVLGGLFFLFGPEVLPDNYQFEELLNLTSEKEVIIIFNSGGWGNTPLEEAEDFVPIVKGIQEILNEWGYNSLVIPYARTKDDLLGEITSAKDFLNSFQTSSEILAEKINFLTENLPDKKIIIAGLSAGATLADETMKKISEKSQVFAIEAGVPFWHQAFESENILQLNNNGKDSLAVGEVKSLLFSLMKTPWDWIVTKIDNQSSKLPRIGQIAAGHSYSWDSPGVGPEIITFLEDKFTPLEKSF